MRALVDAIRELKSNLMAMAIFRTMVDSILASAIAYLVVTLTDMRIIVVLFVGVCYFAYRLTQELDKINYKNVEHKTPALNERLTTAVDYISSQNPIALELKMEVTGAMKEVRTSDYISSRKIINKSALILVFLFASLAYTSLNFDLGAKIPAIKKISRPSSFFKGQYEGVKAPDYELGDPNELFGDASIAKLTGKTITLELNPLATDVDISRLKKEEKKSFLPSDIPDVIAVSDIAFAGDIPAQSQDTVKRYFDLIEAT